MSKHQASTKEIMIWGVSLPAVTLHPTDISYLKKVAQLKRPPVEWIWKEMDRIWEDLKLDNLRTLQGQAIEEFYSHPVWVVNGVFSAIDPTSVKHRASIAEFVSRIGVKHAADYGGGFGELALKLHAVDPEIHIDIVEPYPSEIGMLRVKDTVGIRFINEFDGQYDCVIAQDVLEHVDRPLALAEKMVHATRPGGYLIFANCFFPVIKCHLPSTFYLRHTFTWVAMAMGLKYEGRVSGADHALIFRKAGSFDRYMVKLVVSIAKLIGPVLNSMIPRLGEVLQKIRNMRS